MNPDHKELYLEKVRKHNLSIYFPHAMEEIKRLHNGGLSIDFKILGSILLNHNPNTGTSRIHLTDPGGEVMYNDYLNTEKGNQEARRYLLANNLIQATPENVAGIEHITVAPGQLAPEVLGTVMKQMEDEEGTYVEETYSEILETTDEILQDIRFENGVLVSFKTEKKHKCAVGDYFNYDVEGEE